MLMGKRLDASIETVFPADKVKVGDRNVVRRMLSYVKVRSFWRTAFGLGHSKTWWWIGAKGIDIIESGDQNMETILHADRVDTSSFIFFEPAHSTFDHTDKSRWEDSVINIAYLVPWDSLISVDTDKSPRAQVHTRIDRVFELVRRGVRGVRARSARILLFNAIMSLYSVSLMSLKLQQYHSLEHRHSDS